MRFAIILALLALPAAAQTRARNLVGYATADLPATCTDGDLAYDKTVEQVKECTSNTWAALAGASAPGGAKYIVAEADATLTAEVAPSAGDQVPVSDSSSAATWRTMTDSNAANQCLQYDTATNAFSAADHVDTTTTQSVAGDKTFSGFVRFSSTGLAVDTDIDGDVTIGGDAAVTGNINALAEIVNSTQSAGACTADRVCIDDAAEVNGTLNVDGATTLASTLAVTGAGTFTATAGNPDVDVDGDLDVGQTLDVTGVATFSANVDARAELVNNTQAAAACGAEAVCVDDNFEVNGTAQFDGAGDFNSTVDIAADVVFSGTADLSSTGTGTNCAAGAVCVNDTLEVNDEIDVDGTGDDTPGLLGTENLVKASGYVDGQAGDCSVTHGFNVTAGLGSCARTAAGRYTVTYTNALGSTAYVCTCTPRSGTGVNDTCYVSDHQSTTITFDLLRAGALSDGLDWMFICVGP